MCPNSAAQSITGALIGIISTGKRITGALIGIIGTGNSITGALIGIIGTGNSSTSALIGIIGTGKSIRWRAAKARRHIAAQQMRSDLSGRRGAYEPEARALACASHSLVCGTDMRCAYAVQQPTPRLEVVGGCGAVGSGGRGRGKA